MWGVFKVYAGSFQAEDRQANHSSARLMPFLGQRLYIAFGACMKECNVHYMDIMKYAIF